jgi:DNA-directed RNA polymerase specialized sigma24 family protein
VLANPGISTPEATYLSDEFIEQVEQALAQAKPEEREAFSLFAIEGFTVEEIAQVYKRDVGAVKKAIRSAHDLVDHKLPNGNALKEHLLKNSLVA